MSPLPLTDTVDPVVVIAPLINLAVLQVHLIGGLPSRKLDKSSLTAAMDEAITKPRLGGVCITIDVSHLHFDMRVVRNWSNWSQMRNNAWPAPPLSPPPLSVAAVAGTVAAAIPVPAPHTVIDVATAVTASLTAAGVGAATGPGGAGVPAGTASAAISTAACTFNHTHLDPDVKI